VGHLMYAEQRSRGVTRLTGSALQAYPIGAIYFSDRNTDPASLFGGTWERFAKGRMLVGLDEANPLFDTALEEGGSERVTLTHDQIPEHEHNVGSLSTTQTGSAHTHGAGSLVASKRGGAGSAAGAATGNTTLNGNINITGDTDTTGSGHTHTISGDTGGVVGDTDDSHDNMSPYIVVYMWRRTA